MRAADGAIEVVRLDADVTLQVIGDVAPLGLCGSGLVDAVAELVKVGLLDASGRFVTDEVAATLAPTLAPRPVSYTHLDVYKRQTQEYADVVGADGYAADASQTVKRAKALLEARRAKVMA